MNWIKVGQYLKSIREKKAIDYDKIFEQTRIQPEILKDIEEGTSRLSPVFLKGFIRTYARVLSVDLDQLLKDQPQMKEIETSPETSKEQPAPSQKKFLTLEELFLKYKTSCLGVFFFIIIFSYFQLRNTEDSVSDLDSSFLTQSQSQSSSKELVPPASIEKTETVSADMELLIFTPKNLEIYFKIDGQKLETRKLSEDEWYNIKATNKIYLRFDQAKKVQVFHQGTQILFDDYIFERTFSSDTM